VPEQIKKWLLKRRAMGGVNAEGYIFLEVVYGIRKCQLGAASLKLLTRKEEENKQTDSDNRTQQLRRVTLSAEDFIGRFMQHILPRGFPKVRYYGLASASRQKDREQARTRLKSKLATNSNDAQTGVSVPATKGSAPSLLCPHCRIGHLIVMQILRPQKKFPP
jgi:hypothetical protein